MSNLVLQFFNYSSAQWNPDQNATHLQAGGNSIQTWPNGPLLPYSGSQQCDITENLSKLDVGPSDFYYCWNNGTWRFGVKISATVQVADMGDRPTWDVMYDQNPNSSTINWIANGSSPGDQYTWPSSIGYVIMGTPNSQHNALSVKVVING